MNFIRNWHKKILSDRIHYVFLFLILAVGAALRIYFLPQPPNYDESFSFYYYAFRPLSTALSDYTYPNNHLFHTLLCHIAYFFGGSSIIVLRMPVFIAGVLLPASIYVFARLISDKRTALMAAALAAASGYLIEYSTNARGYSIVSLLFMWLLIIAYFIKYGSKKYQLYYWALLVTFAVLGLYTIPTMIYPLAIVFAWICRDFFFSPLAFIKGKLFRKVLASLLLIFTLSFLAYLPVLIKFGIGAVTGNRFVKPLPFQNFTRGLPQMLQAAWGGWSYNWMRPICAPILAGFSIFYLFIFYLTFYKKGKSARWRDLSFFAFSTPLLLLFLLFLQRVIPPPRAFIFALCLFFIFSSAGISQLLKFILRKWAARHRIMPLIHYGLILIFLFVPAAHLVAGREYSLPTEEAAIETRSDIELIILALRSIAPQDTSVVFVEGYHPGYHYYAFHHDFFAPIGFDPTYPLRTGIDYTKKYFFVFHHDQFKITVDTYKIIEAYFLETQKARNLSASCEKQFLQFEHSYIVSFFCQ